MSDPTRIEIVAIYRREAEREANEVQAGRMAESSHSTVRACVRTHVHYLLRQTPEAIEAQQKETAQGAVMTDAWRRADALIRDAGIWDGPPDGVVFGTNESKVAP
jgi:hypothetical protein